MKQEPKQEDTEPSEELKNPMDDQIGWYYEGSRGRNMTTLLPFQPLLWQDNWYISLILGEQLKANTGLIQPQLDRTHNYQPWPYSTVYEGLTSKCDFEVLEKNPHTTRFIL
jgi:hypothetical protein